MFRLNLQFGFAGFANPMVLTVDEGVIVDPFAVVRRADFTLHGRTPGPTD